MSSETNWLEIKKEYLRRTVDGEKVNLSELAKEYDVKVSTLRSRKSRERWDDFLENIATNIEMQRNTIATDMEGKGHGKNKASNSKGSKAETDTKALERARRGIGQLGNKNAIGNKGGNGAPIGNKRAEKHGFYAKHLPAETLELFDELQEMDQVDMIWDSIRIKYAAIIRAQTIMFVEDKYDITQHLKKHKVIKGMSFTEEKEWELQFAWDKYANFLQAQSRAMGELRSLIKSYNELIDRGMATQEQELRIKRLQVEIDKLDGGEKGDDVEEWVEAIQAIAEKRKGNE